MRHIQCKGFTLVELMIVVVVIAILGTIALPSYQETMRKGKRADAKNTLLQIAALQERFYSDNGAYGALNIIAGSATITSDEGYYDITVALGGGGRPQTYTLTATRLLGQQDDNKCGDFTYNQAGVKALVNQGSGITADQCW